MKTNIIFGFLLLGFLLACKASLSGTAFNNDIKQSNNKFNFELVKEWVKDKRIVSLGESTHGIGEFFTLKSELIQYLHQESNFEILAFEGGFGDINLVWLNIDELNSTELRDKSIFGNFRCKEVEPLFQYIKSESQTDSPLVLVGIDPQVSGTFYEERINLISSFLKLQINVEEEFSYYNKIFQSVWEPDSTNFVNYRDRYQSTLKSLIRGIKEDRNSIMDSLHFSNEEIAIIQKSLELQFDAVDYPWQERMDENYFPAGMEIRDLLMAENLNWIIENLYPDKKIIIWGHNAHVQSGPSNPSIPNYMGQHLKEKFGEEYFGIGLFAYKGTLYQHGNRESLNFENSNSNHIEHLMSKGILKYSYMNFSTENKESWINKPVQAFEPENTGIVTFIPSKRFDAAICILEGSIPNFE